MSKQTILDFTIPSLDDKAETSRRPKEKKPRATKRKTAEDDEERSEKIAKLVAEGVRSNLEDERICPRVRAFLRDLTELPFLVLFCHGNADATVENSRVVPLYPVLREHKYTWLLVQTTSATRACYMTKIELGVFNEPRGGSRSLDKSAKILKLNDPSEFSWVTVRSEKLIKTYVLEPPRHPLTVHEDMSTYTAHLAEFAKRHKEEHLAKLASRPFPTLHDFRVAIKGWINRALLPNVQCLGSFAKFLSQEDIDRIQRAPPSPLGSQKGTSGVVEMISHEQEKEEEEEKEEKMDWKEV